MLGVDLLLEVNMHRAALHPTVSTRTINLTEMIVVALEVNNSSLVKKNQRLNCYQNYRTMLALCQQYRVPIVVDSDAHDPSWVGRQDLACALLESVGFDEDLVLNADLARLKSFLGVE